MGIDDVADQVEEQAKQMDEDNVRELAEDMQDYLDRIESLKRVMDNMDARMENIENDVENIKSRLAMLENLTASEESSDDVYGSEWDV